MRFTLLLIAPLAACVGIAERPLSVREIVENASELDGQEVLVTGWIEYCHRLSCPLFDSADEVGREWPYVVSIGPSRRFDDFVEQHAPMRITFRARMNDVCVTDPATRIIAACADRSRTLEPLSTSR